MRKVILLTLASFSVMACVYASYNLGVADGRQSHSGPSAVEPNDKTETTRFKVTTHQRLAVGYFYYHLDVLLDTQTGQEFIMLRTDGASPAIVPLQKGK